MDLSSIQSELSELGLKKEQQQALLNLIDHKINNDMKEVINKMDVFNSELKRVEDKMDTKFTMIIWAIGLLIALIIALKVF